MRDLGLVNHNEPVTAAFHAGHGAQGRHGDVEVEAATWSAPTRWREKYGCDTGRLYTLFAAPPEKDLEWSEQAIEGCARFLQRVYRLVAAHAERLSGVQGAFRTTVSISRGATEKEKALLRKAHQALRRVTHDFETALAFQRFRGADDGVGQRNSRAGAFG